MHHLRRVRIGIQHIHRQLAHSHAYALADNLPFPIHTAAELRTDPFNDIIGDFFIFLKQFSGKGIRRCGGQHFVLNLYNIGDFLHRSGHSFLAYARSIVTEFYHLAGFAQRLRQLFEQAYFDTQVNRQVGILMCRVNCPADEHINMCAVFKKHFGDH